eukprot:COSAG01_NODE_69947_length_260_cov_0.559006_1_plen_30_part_10
MYTLDIVISTDTKYVIGVKVHTGLMQQHTP